MATTTTLRRNRPPRSLEGVMKIDTTVTQEHHHHHLHHHNHNNNLNYLSGTPNPAATAVSPGPVATVRRNKCGTSPFDENWLNVDCCGLFCAFLTYALHAYGIYAVCIVLLPPWMSNTDENGVRSLSVFGHIHRVAFTFVAIMAVYAHFKAMTTDPGAVPPDAIPLEEFKKQQQLQEGTDNDANTSGDPEAAKQRKGKRICRRCNSFKPPRAHHCSVCRRCIIKMDHHCPWVNNCVGIGNHKYFLLFVFYTALSCFYTILLVASRFMSCMHRHGHSQPGHHFQCLDRPAQLLTILGLFVEAILFGMFTCCMMVDQASVVSSNLTHIDRLKGGGGMKDGNNTGSTSTNSTSNPRPSGIIEVFGLSTHSNKRDASFTAASTMTSSRFRFDWLSPFAKACFPASLQDEIMGFCRPCLGGTKNSTATTTPTAAAAAATTPNTTITGGGASSATGSTSSTLELSTHTPANSNETEPMLRTSLTGSQMVRSVAEIV